MQAERLSSFVKNPRICDIAASAPKTIYQKYSMCNGMTCADMVRVGALRRISKSLLPHSLHAVDSKAKSDAVSELKEMLAGSSNAAEAGIIQRELDQLKQVLHAACPIVLCAESGQPGMLPGFSSQVNSERCGAFFSCVQNDNCATAFEEKPAIKIAFMYNPNRWHLTCCT